MQGAFSLVVCIVMRARVSGGGCVSVCVCARVSVYPYLSGDITPEVSDVPGASNKGNKTAVDICDLTASHSGTHTYKTRDKDGDRHKCFIMVFIIKFDTIVSCFTVVAMHLCASMCVALFWELRGV